MNKAPKSTDAGGENTNETSRKFEIAGGQDLPDNPRDEKEMKSEPVIIDIPDVKDIPGQEYVTAAPLGELADDTASSEDEEADEIFENEESEDSTFVMGTEGDVTAEEKKDLQTADEDMPTTDEQNLRQASLDNTDNENEALNEQGFGKDISGNDLDVPGSEEDDANEEIGEEDEENNPYSMGDNDTSEPTQ
jgi:hypothetical protein